MIETLSRKEEILMFSAMAYDYIEIKLKEHIAFTKEILKGCEITGYAKFIPLEYIQGYEHALANISRILSDIKIGG